MNDYLSYAADCLKKNVIFKNGFEYKYNLNSIL